MKKILLVWLALGLTFGLSAAGQRETADDFKQVTGSETWSYQYDISTLEAGEYNVLIRAEDPAGNVRLAGPFNIFVDPASDFPDITINSPTANMRTTGKLNVVGTAIDDDSIDFVEVQLGEDGQILKASGTKYWSAYFDMSALPDGPYSIRARGTDINGLTSPWRSVQFHLDQYKPLIKIVSHELGVLINGSLRLTGEISEPNGLTRFEYSLDGKENWADLGTQYVQERQVYAFNLEVDSKKKPDGPQIVWFRATNPLKNNSETSFLYFADNTPPEVEFIRPLTELSSLGIAHVAGRILDDVGVKSLSWQVSNEMKGEFTLTPGDRNWVLDLDFSRQNDRNRSVRVTATDFIGNVVTREYQLKLDPEADRPRLSIHSPATTQQSPAKITPGTPLVGFIQDDDGVKSLVWSWDRGESGTLETNGGFVLPMNPPGVGNQRLTLKAVDSKNIESQPLTLVYSVTPNPPRIAVDRFTDGRSASPYIPGHLLPPEPQGQKNQVLEGSLITPDTNTKMTAQLNDGRSVNVNISNQNGRLTWRLNLSELHTPGRNNLTLTATDSYSQQTVWTGFYLSRTNDLFNADNPTDVFFVRDSRLNTEGLIALGASDMLQGTFYAETEEGPQNVLTMGLVPPNDLVEIGFEPSTNGGVTWFIRAKGQGITGPTRLSAGTESGQTFESSQTFVFNTDTSAPVLELVSPAPGAWANQKLTVEGKIAEAPSRLKPVEYSLDGVSWIALPPAPAPRAGSPAAAELVFRAEIDIAGLEAGTRILQIKAADLADNTAIVTVPFFKDAEQPQLNLVLPLAEEAVDGLVTIVGEWAENGYRDKLEFSDDGRTWVPLTPKYQFTHQIDFSKYATLPSAFLFRATDRAGNTATLEAQFTVDAEKDKPKVTVQIPSAGEVFRTDFNISGIALDDDGVKEIHVRIDGKGDFIRFENVTSFSIPISLNSITDDRHFVEAYAVDLNNTRGDTVRQEFAVSRSGPVSVLKSPDLSKPQRGVLQLQGTSEDPNGVAQVLLSWDNGNSFQVMNGTADWSYSLDTKTIADGLYTFLIRAIDTTGAPGDYSVLVSVDNNGPELSLTKLIDGDQVAGEVVVEGRVIDNLLMSSLDYQIKFLDGNATAIRGSLPITGAFNEPVSLQGLAPGWYNLQLEAKDDAGNSTFLTRNIQVVAALVAERLEILNPVQGALFAGPFQVSARLISKNVDQRVTLTVNRKIVDVLPLDKDGFVHFQFTRENLEQFLDPGLFVPGKSQPLSISLETEGVTGPKVVSPTLTVTYATEGPWVVITSHKTGDFITNRPFMTGQFGYYVQYPEGEMDEEGNALPTRLYGELGMTFRQIIEFGGTLQISLDNGVTFQDVFEQSDANETSLTGTLARGVRNWRYRLQTHEFRQGDISVLARVIYPDGSIATARTLLVTDTVAPEVSMVHPQEFGRFNEILQMQGTAYDLNGLEHIGVMLRKGSKDFYQVPAFIQGMYFDVYGFGATTWSSGLGLSFFDQNVKLQGQIGQWPQYAPGATQPSRFFGNVLAVKLLANIASFPFGYYFGPDWDWFSMSLSVGANFSLFSMNEGAFYIANDPDPKKNSVVLGAMLAQWEFARITFADWSVFKSWGLYSEIAAWYIPSDVAPDIRVLPSVGLRIGIF